MHLSQASPRRVSVALFEDADVVTRGIQEICSADPRFRPALLLPDGEPGGPVDIALIDPTRHGSFQTGRGCRLMRHPSVGRVVAFSWDPDPAHITRALGSGFAGWLSKDLDAGRLASAFVRLAGGEQVVELVRNGRPVAGPKEVEDWRASGLTAREVNVLALITYGLSNNHIADELHLSINSVKSYIRTAYRKIGVESRSQALLWSLHHGIDLDPAALSVNAA